MVFLSKKSVEGTIFVCMVLCAVALGGLLETNNSFSSDSVYQQGGDDPSMESSK
jgi:hypothetical protein